MFTLFFGHFNVYRDTIAAPGPVSLLSYLEKLITALTREGMAYGDTKSLATKYSFGLVRRLGIRTRYLNGLGTCTHITTKMAVVQILQTTVSPNFIGIVF